LPQTADRVDGTWGSRQASRSQSWPRLSNVAAIVVGALLTFEYSYIAASVSQTVIAAIWVRAYSRSPCAAYSRGAFA